VVAAGITRRWRRMRDGTINNLTNPKPLVFMVRSCRCSSIPRADGWRCSCCCGATPKATGLVVQGAVALAARAVGRWLARRPGIVRWQGGPPDW
jgi:threonine/homoserine/homoserine lactone efflux protein